MTDVNKAIQPVEIKHKAPINAGSTFKYGNYIQFFIGASDVGMWLVNDSYLKLDLHVAASAANAIHYTNKTGANLADGANLTGNLSINTYIRNAANLFDRVEILQNSRVIYHEEHFIESNTIEQLELSEDYMRVNPQMYTTTNMAKTGNCLLRIQNTANTTSAAVNDNTDGTSTRGVQTIKDILIPANRIMRIFQDMTSEGFPIFALTSPIELRLYIAQPWRYLVDYCDKIGDFGTHTATNANIRLTDAIRTRFGNDTIEIKDVDLVMSHYIPNEVERSAATAKINSSGETYRYRMIKTAFRSEAVGANSSVSIPFTLNTSNVSSLLLWGHKTDLSPGIMYRPNLHSLYIQFGANQLPKQPYPNNSFEYPYDYRYGVDDVMNSIDTYYSQTNFDLNNSYKFIAKGTHDTAVTVPTSSYVMMGANYVNDPEKFGSNSKAWNGQYQVHFMNDNPDSFSDINFCLSVITEYGMRFKDGTLETRNI